MDLSVIQKCYQIKKNVHTIIHTVKKEHRYGVGKHTEDSIQNVLESILFAKQASKHMKADYLTKSLVHLDLFRINLRLMLDIKVLDNDTNLWKIHEETTELGKMLGGWLRSVK